MSNKMDEATRRRVRAGQLLLAGKGCAEVAQVSMCHTAKCMSGAFSGDWALATRSRNAAPSSAMKMQCRNSKARPGPRSKKIREGKAADRLYRRIGHQRTSDARAHLGAERPDARDSVSLQLDTSVGDCRVDQSELSVPLSRREHQEGANRRVSEGAQGAFEVPPC